mgnify:CR=1 FL=1
MRREIVTSAHNPLLTHLKKLLSSRSYREKCGEFAADGTKLLEEAARWYRRYAAERIRWRNQRLNW